MVSSETKILNGKKVIYDTNGGIIIMKAHIDDKILLLYGSNTEVELIKTLCDLDQMLGKFYYDSYNEVFFVGDFNLFIN